MRLTKSDFMAYLDCAKALWLAKRDPDVVPRPAPSAFDRLLARNGYAVEAEVKRLVAGWPDAAACSFQRDFATADGLYARADLVRQRADGAIDLFEIKSSTGLRSSTGRDHVIDAGFQTLVAERAGQRVAAVHVIHIDKEYVRRGDVDPASLLTIADVTEAARQRLPEIADQADEALALLARSDIERQGCTCLYRSRGGHCAAFNVFNPFVPERSIYDLPRISGERLALFVDENRFGLDQIDVAEVTPAQAPALLAAQRGAALIDRAAIRGFLDRLDWPLHLYDYETFATAIPIADGLRPHQQIPIQFSLHRLPRDGAPDHVEFLAQAPLEQRALVERLEASVGPTGDLVVWNAPFERGCNERLAELLPDKAAFLADLNARTVDLMDVFKADYVDPRFAGSTSIKKVLPALCPELSYDQSKVHDGAGAMEAWLRMIDCGDAAERAAIARELLDYCRLDSLAMVEIFRQLERLG